jgi:hypothetical protein
MSVKSKLLASAAALTLVGGVGMAGALTAGTASAETPSCGSGCIDLFNFGVGSTWTNPSYLLDSYKQEQAPGSPIILFATSNTDPAEDFVAQSPEPVQNYLEAGLVGEQVALHYGCVAGEDFSQCSGTGGAGVNDYAFEIEYSPFGAPTGQCVGVAATATAGEHVTLQPCGVSGKTLWIWDTPCFSSTNAGVLGDYCATFHHGRAAGALNAWQTFWETFQVPLINGSDTNFSQPFVLTYPSGASPIQTPRPQLTVQNLTTFSNSDGFPNGDVSAYQLWGADFGEVQP